MAGAVAWAGVWVAGIFVVAVVAVPWVISLTGNEPFSMVSAASQAPRWFLFSMGIVLVASCFGGHVAAGMTRRSFAIDVIVVLLGAGLVAAALATAAFAAEHAVHTALGWPGELMNRHLFTSGDQLGLVFLENAVMSPALAASGCLVSATYYRLGGWRGTLLLPVTVGTALLAGAVLQVEWMGDLSTWTGVDDLPLAARAAAAVVVVAVIVAATFRTLRGAHIRHEAT